ncbi:MAG: hypothetical protein AVDCRST_MAG28-4031 [uncultured Rubrobacteraceae bacterium]|uniref:Sucrose phosphatase-like domain-containing protein n=1 Tax=uncultured Rubrobacteraceae bacterium TaxID=349277 RepID=A0A6J4R6J3_9ACTN|nr:MAG: hypothetical protein AVDCRST_MAG28-4031 [uncultured Rubrobacteraceae bacterium]
MRPQRALVLDLDYTLLHLQALPDAIEVPGRTRSAYLATATAEALASLHASYYYDITLATARSWHGTQPVVDGLARRGVAVSGVVLEDGALLGPPGQHYPLEPERSWTELRRSLEDAMSGQSPLTWQEDFEACLVARAETPVEAETLLVRLGDLALSLDPTLRVFRDGRKVYLTGRRADKWTALEALLGERAAGAVGIGDGANDVCWLSRVATPCTLASAAPAVVSLVGEAGGLISETPGHEGIGELLRRIPSLSLD